MLQTQDNVLPTIQHTHAHTHMHIHTHAHIHTCTYMHIHTQYTHMHIHTHTQPLILPALTGIYCTQNRWTYRLLSVASCCMRWLDLSSSGVRNSCKITGNIWMMFNRDKHPKPLLHWSHESDSPAMQCSVLTQCALQFQHSPAACSRWEQDWREVRWLCSKGCDSKEEGPIGRDRRCGEEVKELASLPWGQSRDNRCRSSCQQQWPALDSCSDYP